MNIFKGYFSKIDANHQFKLGIEEHRKGRIDNAITLFSRAIDKYENHLPSLNARGSLYIDLVRWDKALLDLERVKNLNPKTQYIDFLLGICQCGLGNFDYGIELLSKQIELTPKRPEAYWNRAIAYKNIAEFEKALTDINKSIDILRRDVKLYCIKAEILEDLNKFKEAESALDKAIELEEKAGIGLMYKSEYLERNGKTTEAIEALDKMLKEYPFDGHLFMKRGDLYQYIGENDLAENDYKSAIQNGVTEAKQKLKNIA